MDVRTRCPTWSAVLDGNSMQQNEQFDRRENVAAMLGIIDIGIDAESIVEEQITLIPRSITNGDFWSFAMIF